LDGGEGFLSSIWQSGSPTGTAAFSVSSSPSRLRQRSTTALVLVMPPDLATIRGALPQLGQIAMRRDSD